MIELLSDEAKAHFRRLMELRVAHDEAQAAAKKAEKEYRECEADVWESISESSIKGTVKVDLGEPFGVTQFGATETHYAQVVDAGEALEYYEGKHELAAVTEPKLVMRRINEEVRRRIEEGGDLPPGVTYRTTRRVPITREKK